MQSRGSYNHFSGFLFRSRLSTLMLSMLSIMASIYVAGRLWQDAENRVYLIKELDRRTGQGRSAISVDDTLKLLACKDQKKKLLSLEMELAAAKHEGFVPKHSTKTNGTHPQRLLLVVGIVTSFGRKNNRDAIRKAWLPSGQSLMTLEKNKGIVLRFVIGRSSNRGDSLDRAVDNENSQTKDILILDDHVEAPEESQKKAKLFFAHAADNWDAEFYAKVNDNVYVKLDALGAILRTHMDKPRAYIGCMKSGEVFTEPSHKWYEPDSWKFGDGRTYFRHASGDIFVISRALAQFVSINRSILRTYAHDDVSAGSWFIGVDAKYIDEGKFCCSSWSTGAICSGV